MFVALGPSVRLWYYIVVREVREVRPKIALLLPVIAGLGYRSTGRSRSAEIKVSDERGGGTGGLFFVFV